VKVAAEEGPPAPVTTTSADPVVPAGAVAVIDVSLLTVKLSAGTPPKVTDMAPVNPVPVMVTTVPPVIEPVPGVT
jgi:hypothetical protein